MFHVFHSISVKADFSPLSLPFVHCFLFLSPVSSDHLSPPVLLFLSSHVPLFFFNLFFTFHYPSYYLSSPFLTSFLFLLPFLLPPLFFLLLPIRLYSSSSLSTFTSSSSSSSCCCCSPVWTEPLFSPLSSSLDDRPFLEFRNPSHF